MIMITLLCKNNICTSPTPHTPPPTTITITTNIIIFIII